MSKALKIGAGAGFRVLAASCLLPLCLALGACAVPRPIGLHHPVEGQKLLRSASHWRRAAYQIAEMTQQTLPPGSRVLIETARPMTTFSDHFERLLETRLMQLGLQPERLPSGARPAAVAGVARLSLRHEVIELHPDTSQQDLMLASPALTGAGALALTQPWDWHSDAQGAAALAVGLASSWIGPPTSLELVTTLRLSADALQWQDMRIAYIDEGDRHLYERRLPPLGP